MLLFQIGMGRDELYDKVDGLSLQDKHQGVLVRLREKVDGLYIFKDRYFENHQLEEAANKVQFWSLQFLGNFLVYDFWTPPLPPPINIVHDHFFPQKISIRIWGYVRLKHFLGRALRLGQARGPSAAATYLGRVLRLAQARGPRTG